MDHKTILKQKQFGVLDGILHIEFILFYFFFFALIRFYWLLIV